MHMLTKQFFLRLALVAGVLLIGIIIWQIAYIKYNGSSVAAPKIPRGAETFGSGGPVVRFVVLGDSTSIAQGAPYADGIARKSALYLAHTHKVKLINYGVSGARTADVLHKQVSRAADTQPDLALIAVGANDVTHLTSLGSIETNMTAIITTLQAANPDVKIVLTGSPAMGSVSRFAPPTQWLAGWRTGRVNLRLQRVADAKSVVLVPLAARTGPTFKAHPELFAADNFHPNADGYAVWQPFIEQAIAQTGIPSHP